MAVVRAVGQTDQNKGKRNQSMGKEKGCVCVCGGCVEGSEGMKKSASAQRGRCVVGCA